MLKSAEQADKHVQAAEKCLKTGFTKWKPDLEGAAAEYAKAAVAYKNADSLDRAKAMYEKAAECQLQLKQLFHAAKSYEQAALIARDKSDFNDCAKLSERACNMLLENGTPDTAVLTLLRGAKMVEGQLPDKAIGMFFKAATIYENENNHRQAADAIRPAARILIKNKKFDEAVTALQKEINYNAEAGGDNNLPLIHRLVACMVLLHLYRGDCVAAEKALKNGYRFANFGDSDEAGALESLLDAINQGDDVSANNVLNMPLFKHLDNEFAKLARDLRENPPEDLYTASKRSVNDSSRGTQIEEDYPEGLC